MNAYPAAFKDGDFVLRLSGCDDVGRSCENEFATYWEKRRLVA